MKRKSNYDPNIIQVVWDTPVCSLGPNKIFMRGMAYVMVVSDVIDVSVEEIRKNGNPINHKTYDKIARRNLKQRLLELANSIED